MAGSRNSSNENDELIENHEINVTPFIDVMLVLLIIFMVAAPLATVDISVDLPKSAAVPQPRPAEPLYVTVQEDLSVSVGEKTVAHADLKAELDRVAEGDQQTRVFLRADRKIEYGELMTVMNLLRLAGYTHIALDGMEEPTSSLEAAPFG